MVAAAASLPAFALESEATNYIARISSAPSTPRQKTINKFIKRLKDGGVWTKIDAAWLIGADEQTWMLNLKSSSFTLTKVGAPTFAANDGVTGSNTAYYDTGWNPATQSADINDFHVSCYSKTVSTTSGSDLGLVSTNGIKIDTSDTGQHVSYRLNGANAATTSAATDGTGLVICSQSGTTASIYRNGQLMESAAYTPAAAVSLNLHLLRVNNATSSSGRKTSFVSVGKALSAALQLVLFAALETYLNEIQYGEIDVYEAGYQPASISADLIVYGATAQGCLAAYEAVRQGKTALIVGGWRDRHVGGMSSGGLGFADIDSSAALGGLPRLLITKINADYSRADTIVPFEPRRFERQLRSLMDATRTGGLAIPVYWSTGISAVSKSGLNITSIRTADGRTFSGSQFCDASYEGDLMALAGCSYIVGREASGSGAEAANGYRGTSSASNGDTNEFALPQQTTFYNIDPYVVAGNAGSGLLSGVHADPSLSTGAADSKVQAYTYRLTFTTNALSIATPSAVAPSGFAVATYEPLLRFLKALTDAGKVYGVDYSIDDLLKISTIVGSTYDINSNGGQSIDLWGGSWTYPAAVSSAREVIVQTHQVYVKGLLYLLRYGRTNEGDTRIPAALETAARTYGYHRLHYTDPYPGDDIWWPYQLYVREARRLVGDYVHNGNDITAVDGTTPRSVKTIAVASYAMDSHHTEAIADLSGTPRVWNTGAFLDHTNGGVDQLSPIPFEAIVPKAAECTNLTVTFAVSSTHVAFGSMRMELTAMAMGQAAGLAAVVAIENGTTIQNVNYTTLRTRLLASNTNSGEVVPVLPQLN